MPIRAALFALTLSAFSTCPVAAEPFKHQILGLFAPEREADLRDAASRIPMVKLVSIDFKNGEATFDYDPAKAFPGAKPHQIVERLDNLLRGASNHTFAVKPLRTTPREKLTVIEIPVAGCDCKACSLALYEIVSRVDGVEMATGSFREGRVSALIDPAKTDRAKLEEVLKKRGVDVKKK